jgi:hypothetical protein
MEVGRANFTQETRLLLFDIRLVHRGQRDGGNVHHYSALVSSVVKEKIERLTCRVILPSVFHLDGVDDITMPEDHVSGINLGNRSHARLEAHMRMQFRSRTRADEAFVANVYAREFWLGDICSQCQ